MKSLEPESALAKLALLRRTLANAWRLRKAAFIGYLIGGLIEIVGTLATIYATAQLGALLARYVTGGDTGDIWFWLVIDVVAATFIGVGFWFMSYCERLMFYTVTQWSVHSYMMQLCNIDYPDLHRHEIRDQINKVESGFAWIMPNMTTSTLQLCYALLRFLVITVVVAQISWWLLPIIIVFLSPSLIAEARLARMTWFVWDSKGDERHVFWTLFWIFRQAAAQMEIRSLQAKKFLTNKIRGMNKVFYAEQESKFKLASRRVISWKVFEVGGVAIGSVVLIIRFLNGSIAFNQYLFLSGALFRVTGALQAVFGTLTRLQEPLLYAENFYKFIDRPAKIIDKAGAIKLSSGVPKIEVEALSFKYPETKKSIFQNLNLTIESGEHVALVGENGAGKTTLIKLLMRFYQPTSGTIKIGGHDLSDIAIETWYSRIATLFQEFNRYPMSVRENIQLEDRTVDNKLHRAARLSGVSQLTKDWPSGYETILDPSFRHGIQPSGGQLQRIALARAFYRQASVLILDEPTAMIDAKAEYDIFNHIFDEYRDKSVLIVSHRFSTVRRADRIIVLDKGRIIEEGSHQSLIKQNGLYKEMFTKQAEGYK